jgi:F420H(2)-dependent quinone reductase
MSELGQRAFWAIGNRAVAVHTLLYRASGGRLFVKVPRSPTGRMLLLDHEGRKSGKRRTTPLLYIEDGDDLVVVASKGGAPAHPAWFLNLMATPETNVQVGPEKRRVVAREAEPRKKKRLWPRLTEAWSDYDSYQRKTEREIPLVILSPAG